MTPLYILSLLSLVLIASLSCILFLTFKQHFKKIRQLNTICKENSELSECVKELKNQVEIISDAYKRLYARYNRHVARLKQIFIHQHDELSRSEMLFLEQNKKYNALFKSFSELSEDHDTLLKRLSVSIEIQKKVILENEYLRKKCEGSISKDSKDPIVLHCEIMSGTNK